VPPAAQLDPHHWPILQYSNIFLHFFPPANRSAEGIFLNSLIAQTPIAGPIERKANAHDHPTRSTKTGINQIVINVSKNPRLVCSVNAVPRYSGSHNSVIHAEN
jgi:hypothetical protein